MEGEAVGILQSQLFCHLLWDFTQIIDPHRNLDKYILTAFEEHPPSRYSHYCLDTVQVFFQNTPEIHPSLAVGNQELGAPSIAPLFCPAVNNFHPIGGTIKILQKQIHSLHSPEATKI